MWPIDIRWYNLRLNVSDSPRCPACGRPNLCRYHGYVYRNWYVNYYRRVAVPRYIHDRSLFPSLNEWEVPQQE
jgi:transposase